MTYGRINDDILYDYDLPEFLFLFWSALTLSEDVKIRAEYCIFGTKFVLEISEETGDSENHLMERRAPEPLHSLRPPLGVSLCSLIAAHTEESITEVIWLGWNNIPPLPNRRQFLISSLRFYIRKRNFLHLSCDPVNHKIRLRNIMPPTQLFQPVSLSGILAAVRLDLLFV